MYIGLGIVGLALANNSLLRQNGVAKNKRLVFISSLILGSGLFVMNGYLRAQFEGEDYIFSKYRSFLEASNRERLQPLKT